MNTYTVWPEYFDENRSQQEGREINKETAIQNPTLDEITQATQQIGYDATKHPNKSYPKTDPLTENGQIQVTADDSKTNLLHAIAHYIKLLRKQN